MDEILRQLQELEPWYLIGGGLLLIAILAYLLLRIRKGKEEETHALRSLDQKSRSASAVLHVETTEQERGGASESSESPRARSASISQEEAASDEGVSALPVFEKPFEETSGIDRERFEDFRGRRVLMVEDNPVNRKLIVTLLKGSGIEIDLAEDGIQALQKLRQSDAGYDLVLMDVNMPKMNGLECTRQIRSDSALSTIPVVALTASTTPDEVRAILESGMNGYLSKPLNLGKLYTAFEEFLRRNQAPESQSVSSPAKPVSDRPALDTAIGLEHTNNDAGLYRMLLEDFLEQYRDSGERFASYVTQKDYEALHRLVIDLEGLSGTLGAMELYGILLQTNQALEQGATPLLSEFAKEYSEALERFETEAERYLGS